MKLPEIPARAGIRIAIAVPMIWLGIFLLIPFLLVLKISFAQSVIGSPPFSPLIERGDGIARLALNWGNYALLWSDHIYFASYLGSLWIALTTTLCCLLIGFPIAYALARAQPSRRPLLVALVMLPFWTSFLIRIYAWIGILKNHGLIEQILHFLNLTTAPLNLLYTPSAILIGMVYSYLPFAILPLYSTLERIDGAALEAAEDLGASPLVRMITVLLPLAAPGILAAALLVFIPAMGEYVIPELLGPSDSLMIGHVLWQEFFENRDWPAAASVAVILLTVLVPPMLLLQRLQQDFSEQQGASLSPKPTRLNTAILIAGLGFLFAPIISVIVYSFNASRLVTVWGGFSLRWYSELWQNDAIRHAAALSLLVGIVSATIATVLGAIAGIVLERAPGFRGQTLLTALLAAPLVLPEVVTGLSLLLLFITSQQIFGIPTGQGFWTITIAHATFSLSFVAVVVRARIHGLDRLLEEAAADLGASPTESFFHITLPLMTPALLSGWLLAFTLSFDDLVITSFVSGPGYSTLPMVIFSSVRLGVSPMINAFATIMVLAVSVIITAATLIPAWKNRVAVRKQTAQIAANA